MGCADSPAKGVSAPYQSMSSQIGSKLTLLFYADVRFHIPMTHRNDAGTIGHSQTESINGTYNAHVYGKDIE